MFENNFSWVILNVVLCKTGTQQWIMADSSEVLSLESRQLD